MATEPASPSGVINQAATPLTARGRRRLRRQLSNKPKARPGEVLSAYLFMLPYLLVLFVFIVFVSIYGVGLSLFQLDIGFTGPVFVGLRNYQILFNQLANPTLSNFWTSMGNIIEYVVVIVIGQTALALFLAVILQNTLFLKGVFRTIFYIPALTSSVATSLIFLWFYNQDGVINYLLSLIGIHGPDWLDSTGFALPAIMILNIWTTSAAFMIYFLAALQDIPKELIEAAKLDGANRFQAFWNITVPLLRPAIFFVVALGTIGGFQMFDQAKFMTNGGPVNATLTPMLVIYNDAFQNAHFGLAAAESVILFILIMIVTVIQRRLIDPGINKA